MDQPREIELVFAPQDEGGYHVYAPDLPGLHTEGDTLDEATANAQEALALYVEGMREDGRSLDTGVIRRKFPVPARPAPYPSYRGSVWSRLSNATDGRSLVSEEATFD
jgi:predicted RNase H-like HicB family nuclease